MAVLEIQSAWWSAIQGQLFPWLEESVGHLTPAHQDIVKTLEMARLETFLPHWSGLPGRPAAERVVLAHAFVAKAILNLPTTTPLIDRLKVDKVLRRLCGYDRLRSIPSESTFSRAFAEFAASALPAQVHEALTEKTFGDQLVGHISRDSTAIEAPEKLVKAEKQDATVPAVAAEPADGTAPEQGPPALPVKRKRGRPRKGEERPKELRRLERQSRMSLEEMLDDLPKHCAVGTKRNAKGYKDTWIGYKLHLDVADGGVPISGILTSASLQDSQVAIPLATMTAARVTNLDDLMDAAYDGDEIKNNSRSLGHVPIIDPNPRGKGRKEKLEQEGKRLKRLGHRMAEDIRFNERSTVERVNGRLKEEFGGCTVRVRGNKVRGNKKVMCHLMFGLLALTIDQLLRFVS